MASHSAASVKVSNRSASEIEFMLHFFFAASCCRVGFHADLSYHDYALGVLLVYRNILGQPVWLPDN